MEQITQRVSRYVADLRYEHLPEQVLEQVKMFIVDYYAACFAGYRVNQAFGGKVLQLMEQMGGSEESTVLFSRRKLPASNAAFVNAVYAHGADMDDGNKKAAGHIGAHVMSAVFALAEAKHSSWKTVVEAIVAGYDVFNRVVGAAMPSLYNKGFHSTGVGGSLACAAACAKLLGLDYDGIYNAISLSAIQSSGLIIIDETGQGCKPINPANAARAGIISAQLAQLGVESSRNPLESKKGWYNAFCDQMDENVLFDGMNKSYTICESYLKLYPACRHTHCGIDAALELRQQLHGDGLTVSDIEDIRVYIYPSAIKSAGSIQCPKTDDEAKFSIHYCLATALVKGCFGLDELNISYSQELTDIISRITLVPDETMEDRKAGIRGARVCISTRSGRNYEKTVLVPKGEAKKSLTWQDLEKKLGECAGDLRSTDALNALTADIRGMDIDAPFKPIRSLQY